MSRSFALLAFLFSFSYAELSNHIDNSLPDESLGARDVGGSLSCDRLDAEVSRADLSTDSHFPLHLAGKWVSEGCEVRSGPEYILRSYTFSRNHTFRLLQFHYSDASCTSPQFVVTAKGRVKIRGRSWVTPGAADSDYWLERVSVFAHRSSAADELARKVNMTCPGTIRRRWRPFREYVIVNMSPEEEVETLRNAASKSEIPSRPHRVLRPSYVTEDLDCADLVLPAAFHELQLLRVQRRPSSPDHREPRLELLLGDVHSRPELRLSYRPTAYQTPLLRADQASGCAICRVVARSSEKSPPHLPAKARLPVFLSGEWISTRCEVRPLGMFLKRRLRFSQSRGRKWAGEFKYFSDASCSIKTITTHASGRFSNGRDSPRVYGGTDLEFRIDSAALAIHDHGILNALNSVHGCGSKIWIADEIQDVTATGGCDILGINVPTLERELLKIEMDANGNSLLFIGQVDTERGIESNGEIIRPTAYQLPLMQCKSTNDILVLTHHSHRALPPVVMSNQLFPIPHARIAMESKGNNFKIMFNLLVTCLITYYLM